MNLFKRYYGLYKKWSPTTKFLGFWFPIILFLLALFFGVQVQWQNHFDIGDNVSGNKIINNYITGDFNDELLFYHDSVGKFYTAEEKDYLDLVLNYSVALMNLGQYEEAIKISEKAIQKNFSFYGIWINIGNAYFHLGQYEDALDSYDQAITRNVDSKLAWENKCIVLQKLNDQQRLNLCLAELSKRTNN
ncbi:MAG: tetratricopeptide repeat protein [Candidatus Pacebacteria bacterium]|jgi:tetratricopeptide (TPR) repeat protein|nr:tetratricopeptide repeat protein [Candidatus Paceibacterota bacterium]